MKVLKKLVVCIFSILSIISVIMAYKTAVYANDNKADWNCRISNKEVTITGYKGSDTVIEIPQKIGKYTVKYIEKDAFKELETVKKIIIPDTVISIGECAFWGCKNLVTIVIPESVSSIGDYAFIGCKKLTKIKIPNRISFIGEGTFMGCSKIKSVIIPSNVHSIGAYAFCKCSNLYKVVIGNASTIIGEGAFEECGKKGNPLQIKSLKKSKSREYCENNQILFKKLSVVVPEKLDSISISNLYKGIKLEWQKSNGATGYDIYRNSVRIATIGSGKICEYEDSVANKNGKKYEYRIVPFSVTSIGEATEVSIYRLKVPVINSVVNDADRQILVNWNINKKASGYELKIVGAGKTKYSIISNKTTLEKRIKKLKIRKRYKIYIRAYKNVKNEKVYSEWSEYKSVKIKQ